MTWIKAASPKMLHDQFGVYHGQWMPEMDRCWIRKEDGVTVSSRLLNTAIGKIEHVTITAKKISADGTGGFTWAEKQQIKNELFGEDRDAVEVFPKEKYLVDVCDVYHLWVFDKKHEMPFGIHPKQYRKAVNRGALPLSKEDIQELKDYYKTEEGGNL